MAWFKKARKPIAAPDKASRVPEGLWVKCPECDAIIYTRDLVKSLSVCTKCGHHFRLTARERLLSLFDGEYWVEQDANLRSNDPLVFADTKPYRDRLAASRAATGLPDAAIVGVGRIDGIEAVVVAMEYAFIGGSMGVVMGAPNLVLGGSHSGNVSARQLAEEGLLDALSSDYVPVSLLHGAFQLHRELDMPLPHAIAPVSRNPAAMIGLDDRGAIAPGLRADLVRARLIGETPAVVAVWREGDRVA